MLMESQWVGAFVTCIHGTKLRPGNWLSGYSVTRLRERVRQMPDTDDPATLRQYARCYILLMIGGYLMTDKSNNQHTAPSQTSHDALLC
ncbi:uncharacterized protein DS421_13g407170 [Arachis hypogaea]|nr:uncharacterized protein DS421_13g407170 [Arachis hypogaea]